MGEFLNMDRPQIWQKLHMTQFWRNSVQQTVPNFRLMNCPTNIQCQVYLPPFGTLVLVLGAQVLIRRGASSLASALLFLQEARIDTNWLLHITLDTLFYTSNYF